MEQNQRSEFRVLLAATSFPRNAHDWRGRFIHDQTASLARQGINLSLWAPSGELPAGVHSILSADDKVWLDHLLESGGIAHLLRHRSLAGVLAGAQLLLRLRAACKRVQPDLYHINWLQNALALPDDNRPALVTILGSDFRLLRLPGMVTALRRQFRRRRTILSPNADWMASRLAALFGTVATIRPNPFGVDVQWFSIERQPRTDKRQWLIVSRITRDKLGSLLVWGESLFSEARPLRLLGPMQEEIQLPYWIENPGPTTPEALQRKEFPNAAGLLTLSRHAEGRPQILIEAMAAGIPVIASRIPAHENLIRHGETGWLVSSQEELAKALTLAESPVAESVGQAARDFIKTKIGTWDDCAHRYLVAYRDLLSEVD